MTGEAPSKAAPAAMRGDLTQGPVMRTLLLFAVPTLVSNVLQSLNGTINSIWVGRLIGEEALAATANVNIIMFLVSSLAFGFGMAGTVKIGQRFGARDIDGALAGLVLSWAAYRYLPWRRHALAESSEEAMEQSHADGQPAGRMMPEL